MPINAAVEPRRAALIRQLLMVPLTLLLLLALCNFANGRPIALPSPLDEPRFDRIGAGTIPRDVVASLAQDKAGFLWIGTGDGLVRYDGHTFRPQERQSPDPTERNLGWVQTMLQARDGRMWIGTETDGLAMFDPGSGRVSLFRADDAADGERAAPTIVALAEDLDGHLWVGSSGGGFARFDPERSNFVDYRQSIAPDGLPSPRINALFVDRAGTLWVGGSDGLRRKRRGSDQFDRVGWKFERQPHLGEHVVSALYQASDGRVWVGTQQGDLAIVDQADGSAELLDRPARGSASSSDNSSEKRRGAISAFAESPGRQMLWVGSASGIDLYRVPDARLQRQLRHDTRNPSGLAADQVSSLLVDRTGAIWVGGFGVGLQRHDPNNRAIRVRGPDLFAGAQLAAADFRSLLQLDSGELWAATHSAGIAVLDEQMRVSGSVALPDGVSEPWHVAAMAQAADGSIWLGDDKRLYQLDRQHRLLRTLDHGAGATNRLHAATDGSLWVATQDGLHVLRRGAAQLQRIRRHSGAVLAGQVYALAEAADQAIWVGCALGLFRIAAGSDQLVEVESQAGRRLANPTVIGLLVDADDKLWVDTAIAGLHRMLQWDGVHAQFDRISERHGVVNRPFGVNLMQGQRGRIWSHMYVYDPAIDRLHELTAADGVAFGTGWFHSYAKAADGRLLFGGSKGLLVVDSENFNISGYEPPLVVSELRIDGIRRLSEDLAGGLQLAPEQRGFAIEFAALDFSDPTRNRYAYQLEGYDSRWIEVGSNMRVASYSNLDPGDYRLRVRATNHSGVWSPHQLLIPVQIVPAWWQHWLARLLALLLLALGIAAVVHWRTRHLRAGKLALEMKVSERTAELERVALALQQESAALEEASLTDPLSGLRNRRFLSRHIDGDTALAARRYENHLRHGTWLADDADLIFFLVDIDHFKQVNDRHGHAAGDAVIMQIRSRLQAVFRDTDYLVRWGGEEFLIVARGTARSNAAALAERVLANVAEQSFVLDDGTLLHKTCSVGFSCFPLAPAHPRALDWNDAVSTADAALYAVKSAGRNGWLGLVSARAGSAEELTPWVQRPLIEWWRSGQLDMVFSSTHSAWTEAAKRS